MTGCRGHALPPARAASRRSARRGSRPAFGWSRVKAFTRFHHQQGRPFAEAHGEAEAAFLEEFRVALLGRHHTKPLSVLRVGQSVCRCASGSFPCSFPCSFPLAFTGDHPWLLQLDFKPEVVASQNRHIDEDHASVLVDSDVPTLEDRRAERNSQHAGDRLVSRSDLVEDRDPLGMFAEQVSSSRSFRCASRSSSRYCVSRTFHAAGAGVLRSDS